MAVPRPRSVVCLLALCAMAAGESPDAAPCEPGWTFPVPFFQSVAWSPDGASLLFTRDGPWSVAADGSGRTRLLERAVYGAWSPDGSTVAAAATELDAECKDHHSLLLLEPDGTVRQRLLPAD